jgi:hypothetical protein
MDLNAVAALSKEALKKPLKKKPILISAEEEIILADGSIMEPLEVKTSSDVLRASLLMLFKHVADIHVSVVEIVADKFKIPIEDLHKTITDDPRWQEMFVNPLITDLTKTVSENTSPAKKKRGRPPMTPEQKAAAKAARLAAKTAKPTPKPKKKPIIILSDEEEIIFS